ncbi:hypothetical protein [Leptospira levettii]|uniref:Uncharacterized protein n=1 Tax=Leptospira levettii TaxID=2023178 RepID=A0AAW5V690_9LEPT|nr:hypothetical protein [Leptospira levettii]MCW7512116.1 hypothetical protein [Leptospira levettii]MCW7517145.1 hypothetical protein [Leptospira levettii]
MKSRISSPIEYHRRIIPIRKQIKDFESEIWYLEDQFFENLTQTIIPYTLRIDYLNFLKD